MSLLSTISRINSKMETEFISTKTTSLGVLRRREILCWKKFVTKYITLSFKYFNWGRTWTINLKFMSKFLRTPPGGCFLIGMMVMVLLLLLLIISRLNFKMKRKCTPIRNTSLGVVRKCEILKWRSFCRSLVLYAFWALFGGCLMSLL